MVDIDKTIYDPVEVDQDYFAQNPDAWGEFYTKLKTYPQGVIEVLFGADTGDILEKICVDFNLNREQSALLSRLIRTVLIADTYIGDMPAQISSKLGVDQSTALEIARAVVSQLFAPVIEDIKKLQLQKFGKLPSSGTPQQSGVPRPVPGTDLPETGGNIIDLRNQK